MFVEPLTVASAPALEPWASAARRCCSIVFLGLLPVCLLGYTLASVGHHPTDFATFWRSGREILHGRSPYTLSANSFPAHPYPTFAPFVYPPLTAALMAPLSVLPYHVALVVFTLFATASVVLALRLLRVADWRCYGAALASAPFFGGSGLGAISALLLLGVAAAWRYRDRALTAGAAVAFVVTAKLFLWPVWLWLVHTRRYRAAAVAAAASVAGVGAAWAAIGFAGLRGYTALLSHLTTLVGPESYSPYALARSLGAGDRASQLGAYTLAVVAIVAAARFITDERALLAAALAVSFVATPILWPHYLLLLFVPIALVRRSFSSLWLVPVAMWVDAASWSEGNAVRITGLLAMAAVPIVYAIVMTTLPRARSVWR
jgi:alpha-1,2-mannosyltransferase